MPSNKTPDSLQVGPGRLPANVVPASAILQSPPLSAAASSSQATPVLLNVSTTTTLADNLGPNTIVLVDSSGGAFTITLPNQPTPKSFITFIQVDSVTANDVTIDGNGSDPIHGSADNEQLTGLWGVRSFFNRSSSETTGNWMVTEEKPSVQTVSASGTTNLLRTSTRAIVLVDTTAGNVDLRLPSSKQLGDTVTVVTTATSNNRLTVFDSVDDTGPASTYVMSSQGLGGYPDVATFTTDPVANGWLQTSGTPIPVRFFVSATTTLVASRKIVAVINTNSTITITLPTTGVIDGDIIIFKATAATPDATISGAGLTTPIIIRRTETQIFLVRSGADWTAVEDNISLPTASVNNSTSLVRLGRDFTVFVDTADVAWNFLDTITLPSTTEAQIGDRVTVVDIGGLAGTLTGASDLDFILVASSGTINGRANFQIATNFGAATFCYLGSGNWNTTTVGDSQNSIITFAVVTPTVRGGKRLTVLLDTADPSWTSGIINMDSLGEALEGDIVTFKDIGGQAYLRFSAPIIQANSGADTIDGGLQYRLDKAYGSVTLQYDGTSNWSVIASDSIYKDRDFKDPYFRDDFYSAYVDSANSVVFADTTWRTFGTFGNIQYTATSLSQDAGEHVGEIAITTTAVANQFLGICKGEDVNSGVFRAQELKSATFVVQTGITVANIAFQVGIADDLSDRGTPSETYALVRYDSSVGAAFHFVTDNGSGIPEDTAMAYNAFSNTHYVITIRKVSSTEWTCAIDGVVRATHTTTLPATGFVNVGVSIEPLSAASTTLNVDYIDLEIQNFSDRT